jgi:DNA-binding transcriptional LysR family regulator
MDRRTTVPTSERVRPARLSLRQLEAFCAVAMAGGVSSAARRLARTQSAISSAIAELEDTIGTALFERAGRGLRPTDAARRLLPRALEVVERAAELPAIAAGVPGEAERLRVGASRTIGPFVMPGLMAELARRRPHAVVEMSVANTSVLLERLHRLELDLAFVEGDVSGPGLLLDAWMQDALCLFCRAGHPIIARLGRARTGRPPAAYVDALAQSRWALREAGSGTQETFQRAIAPSIGSPRIGATVDDPLALQRMVAEGDWLGCMSRRALADAFAAGRLVELPPPDDAARVALVRRFWLVRLRDRYRTAAVDALTELALAAGDRPAAARSRKA